jgi:Cu+-exporting ATPase
MDLLVALGTSAAYFYSVYVVLGGIFAPALTSNSSQFFETSAVLISFVLLGKWLEARAKGKTSEAIRALAALQPTTATLIDVALDGGGGAGTGTGTGTSGPLVLPPDDVALRGLTAASVGEKRHAPFLAFAAAASRAGPERETRVDAALLQKGDVLKVLPGSHFPADGLVLHGSTSADESMITGESMPVAKAVGDAVIGGTVNKEGMVLILARGVGSDSMLSKVVKLIEDAQTAKAPIQAYADRVSGVFVPVVVAIAIITWIVWFSLASSDSIPERWTEREGDFLFSFLFAITVLVIACPCALGLATPTAVMVGTGLGARMGILIKGGSPLETAHGVTHVVFDKTGTLTEGAPAVTATRAFARDGSGAMDSSGSEGANVRDAELRTLWLAASAEGGSEHPIARAIVHAAVERRASDDGGLASLASFDATPGRGLRATLHHRDDDGGGGEFGGGGETTTVVVGNVKHVVEHGVELTPAELEAVRAEEERGQTVAVVLVAGASRPRGIVCVSDPVRAEASEAIAALHSRGISTSIVSGDNWRVARAVAASVGIRHVIAEALPAGKVDAVADLQRDGRVVAVVGDGVNDAPAMVQSDLGIGIGAGADVAMEAAGVVLVRSNLLDVVAALDISKVTFRRIRLNLFFSLAFNSLGIPIAAGALYPLIEVRLPPEVAGLAMALSSVSVVLSSLSLRSYRPPIGSHSRGDTS